MLSCTISLSASYMYAFFFFFFFNDPATTEIYTLSLHDALPIFRTRGDRRNPRRRLRGRIASHPADPRCAVIRVCDAQLDRSEEHTSELQSQSNLVCRLLLEKKNKKKEM